MSVAALDAGTTGVRCMIVDQSGLAISISRRPWTYETPESLEVAKEFDPAAFWKLASTVIKEAVKAASKRGYKPDAITTTSQRHGMVLLDQDKEELHGSPNIDARGSMTQYIIEDELEEEYYEITGCWPPMMFAPSRIAWFEEDEPEIHVRISHVLPINDWLTFRLSDSLVTEPATACSTGFFDLKKQDWSMKILDLVGFGVGVLPEIKSAGEIIGEVTKKASFATSLPEGLPVVQGGTDTHCALLACQTKPDEIGIIAGSTTPVMLVLDDFKRDPDMRLWSGNHMIQGLWTLESNATMTGAYLEWIVKILCERSENPENCQRRTFNNLESIIEGIPPGSNETTVGLGPNIMDSKMITNVPLARMYFPQPALPSVTPLDSASLIHSVLENITFAIRGNCEQLYQFAEVDSIKAIGGMSQSNLWGQMLANVLNRNVKIPVQSEGSLLGAAICATVGLGWYDSLQDASKSMVTWRNTFSPDERSVEYQGYYSKWKSVWVERE
ncbi:MAG: FGGY-family carbohydrate kinase [Candidatus Thorarchaeota archaeon]